MQALDESPKTTTADRIAYVRSRFQARDALRRGICFLNAGQFTKAEQAFGEAVRVGGPAFNSTSLLGAVQLAQGKVEAAVQSFGSAARLEPVGGRVSEIRKAYAYWQSGNAEQAIQVLRHALALDPECAELHFQLGTLLAAQEQFEEAELRFTQALSIEPEHGGALTSLGLCCAMRDSLAEAAGHLARAQRLKPNDAGVALLLTQVMKAAQQRGFVVRVGPIMPVQDGAEDPELIGELEAFIEADPDFVEAFLSLPEDGLNRSIYGALLETLRQVLRRLPNQSEFHHQAGRVLERLGRADDAIVENERAVELNPRHVRALVELGKLYQKANREADATLRLEQAIAAGAEYADVHYLLGNLYWRQGQILKAKTAYVKALKINEHYAAAREALETLMIPG